MKTLDPNKIIDAIGGTSVVALQCEVSMPAVSKWRRKGIPPARAMLLKMLYPDAFKDRGKRSKACYES